MLKRHSPLPLLETCWLHCGDIPIHRPSSHLGGKLIRPLAELLANINFFPQS